MALHVPRDDGRGFHRPLGDEGRPGRTCFRPEQHALLRASLDRRGHLRDPVSPTTLRSGRGKRRMESRTERYTLHAAGRTTTLRGCRSSCTSRCRATTPRSRSHRSARTHPPSSAQKILLVCCAKLSRKFVWIWKLFVPGIETKEMRLDGAGQEYMDLFPASMFYDKRRMLAMSAFWDEAVSHNSVKHQESSQ